MKVLIVFAAFCISSAWLMPTNGTANLVFMKDINSRIINGQNAAKGQFPWQVAIYYKVGSATYFCGGTLIDREWVLTAAHCVDGASSFTVQLGSNTLQSADSNRVTVTSQKGYKHSKYSASTLAHDIGLIKIPQVTLNDYIKTIPIRTAVLEAEKTLTVSGFGRTSDSSSSISNRLKYVEMTSITNAKCAETYGNSTIIYTMVCAQGADNKNTCGGDSGGPATTTYKGVVRHVGVTSFGSKAGCELGHPAGFTRSRNYRVWVKSVSGLDV